MLRQPAYILIFVFGTLISCKQENHNSGDFNSNLLTIENKSILDTFPLPNGKNCKFITLKTADEYFQSACNRMSDWPDDSVSTYICIREYQNAIKLDSNFWYAYRNLSRCFSKIKRDNLAYKSIELAFKHCPDKNNAPELFDIRGKLLFKQNQFDKSITDFQKLVDLGYSPLADRYYWLALATLKNGQKEKAIKIIKNAKNLDFSDSDISVFEL